MEYNILIGGAAGSGMNTLASIIKVGLKRHGYNVFTYNEIMSRIRGGHNFFQVRFSDQEICTHSNLLDCILAFDKGTVLKHELRLKSGGQILCDTSSVVDANNSSYLNFDAKSIAKEQGSTKGLNMVLLGSLVKAFNLDYAIFDEIIVSRFTGDSLTANQKNYEAGYKSGKGVFIAMEKSSDHKIIINGNQAIALGAIAAGMSFYAAYPMTPATSVMSYLNKKQKHTGILVEQAEDEISAIHLAIGASYTGARAMTGSSGGGISLMVEGIGLAAISEIPLVVVDVQRPGPATGMATKTSQSDLNFILNASQDEFPRIILSIKNQEDAYYQTIRAFDLADKYQVVVFILNDEYLADASMSINKYQVKETDTGKYIADDSTFESDGTYKRFKFTPSGVSPRLIPGIYEVPVVADSHEHDEYGRVVEDGENRIEMHSKRLKKLELIAEDMIEPSYVGVENPDYILTGFGSTWGAIKEAVETLNGIGISIGGLSFSDVYPLPMAKLDDLSKGCRLINVEGNATGQLGKLIRSETGIKCYDSLLKFNGRQISKEEIIAFVKELI